MDIPESNIDTPRWAVEVPETKGQKIFSWVAVSALSLFVAYIYHQESKDNASYAKIVQGVADRKHLIWDQCPIVNLRAPIPKNVFEQARRLFVEIEGIPYLVDSHSGAIQVWNLQSLNKVYQLGASGQSPYMLALVDWDGVPHLASVLEETGKLAIWDLRNGMQIQSHQLHNTIKELISDQVFVQGRHWIHRLDVTTGEFSRYGRFGYEGRFYFARYANIFTQKPDESTTGLCYTMLFDQCSEAFVPGSGCQPPLVARTFWATEPSGYINFTSRLPEATYPGIARSNGSVLDTTAAGLRRDVTYCIWGSWLCVVAPQLFYLHKFWRGNRDD